MTSSVDIFSAVHRTSGGPAVSVEGKQTENTPQTALQREGIHAPDMDTSGILFLTSQGSFTRVRRTKTCLEQCKYMTSHMQAGGGWLGHLRVHIQYTCLGKKYTWLQLKSGWRHAVWCRRHNPTMARVNRSGWAEFTSSHSFIIYIKLLHRSNTD